MEIMMEIERYVDLRIRGLRGDGEDAATDAQWKAIKRRIDSAGITALQWADTANRYKELLNKAASELTMSQHPEAKVLAKQIDDVLAEKEPNGGLR